MLDSPEVQRLQPIIDVDSSSDTPESPMRWRRWRSGSLRPPPGSVVEVPLVENVDKNEIREKLKTYLADMEYADMDYKFRKMTQTSKTPEPVRNCQQEIAQWRCSHPKEKKKYLLLFWRWAGALERGQRGRFLISELPHVMTSPSGRPPVESLNDVKSCQLLERTMPKSHIFADGNKSWASHSKFFGRKCFQVSHVKMEFTRKRRKRGHKTHGTQCIDKKWSASETVYPQGTELFSMLLLRKFPTFFAFRNSNS